jgi:hypothetical protein
MNRLSTAQRVAVVKALVEGNSIRSTVRLTDVANNTVVKPGSTRRGRAVTA